MIATILPRKVFAGNTLNLSTSLDGGTMLVLLAFLNSFVVDYLTRLKVSAHCNIFYVYQLPIPKLGVGDNAFKFLVQRSSSLVCTHEEFSDLWKDSMGTAWSKEVGVTDPIERARLRAEVDGAVAHLYGLTEEEFAYILSTFPVIRQEVKDATLAAYRSLAPRPGDPEILSMIEKGESADLEFKSTARWDLRQGKRSADLEAVIRHTVAGFLNAHGGTLLIGVADDGSVVGLEPDYGTFKKANRDGFELFLTELLLGAMGKDMATSIRTSFHEVDGKDVCRITVAAGPRPVFLREGNDEAFYLRAGNSTRRLSTREAVQYCKAHWPS